MNNEKNSAAPYTTGETVEGQPIDQRADETRGFNDTIPCSDATDNDKVSTIGQLMQRDLPPITYTVEKWLSEGIVLLSGKAKSGKTWMTEQLAVAVATGGEMFGCQAKQGEVLLLALDDPCEARIKERFAKLGESDSKFATAFTNIHYMTTAPTIDEGFVDKMNDYLAEHPDTRLLVVDTLSCIRPTKTILKKADYDDDAFFIRQLRSITNRHNVTLLLVTHNRKMVDSDPINNMIGSVGLVASADSVFVLMRNDFEEGRAKLFFRTRDKLDGCNFELHFDNSTCLWERVDMPSTIKRENMLMDAIDGLVQDGQTWSGTSTELAKTINDSQPLLQMTAPTISKKLRSLQNWMVASRKTSVVFKFRGNSKLITISKCSQPENLPGDRVEQA